MARLISLPENPRILVARTDRIGDVVLSLPVFASLRAAFPDAFIGALTRDYTRDLLDGRDDVDQIFSFDAPNSHIPQKDFARLQAEIKETRFDVAIALFSNFTVAGLLWGARIPKRIGPANKLAQIFLTHRIRQRRSQGLRHEADHNLDLLAPLGVSPLRVAVIPRPASAPAIVARPDGCSLVVGVHPGHGGSSQNWPEEKYHQLVTALCARNMGVIVTGSPGEESLVARVVGDSAARPYIGKRGIKELIAVLSRLDVYVASSTGPLHIASAVGTPVVGIYSPVHVCLPERWGPIGERDCAIRPDGAPCKKCVDLACERYDCMDSITVGQVFGAVADAIERSTPGSVAL